MKTIPLFSLLLVMSLAGCDHDPKSKSTVKEPATMSQPTVVKTIAVSGFDPEGEPDIRQMSDGTLMIVFNFMPPSYAEDEEVKYADFEKELERAIGVPVLHDDREVFLIQKPQSDTIEKLKAFLEGYRTNETE